MDGNASGHSALFPDLQQIIVKPMEDFTLTITSRIEKAKAEEAAKLEAQRQQIEAAAKAKAEAEAAAKIAAEEARIRAEERAKAQAEQSTNTTPKAAGDAIAGAQSETAAPAIRQDEEEKNVRTAKLLSVVGTAPTSTPPHPGDKMLIDALASRFHVSYGVAADWLLETAQRMRVAA